MFKFYKITNLDTIDKIIGSESSIKYSSVFNLNDPYEIKFNLHIDPFANGQQEEFLKMNPSKTGSDFKEWQKQVSDNEGFIWYTEQEQRKLISQLITICSFTSTNKNNLMWSHYTDNHQGICVEYTPELIEYLKSLNGFFAFDKVQYSDEPPVVDILERFDSKISKMIFNKQSEWKYENEYRIVMLSDHDTDFITINQKFIKAVYIGAKMSKELEGRIISLCEPKNIDIFYGVTLGKTYEVTFDMYNRRKIIMRTFWR